MATTTARTSHRASGARAAPPSKLDRLAVEALGLEAVPVVALVAAVLGVTTTNGTVGTLLDVSLLGLPAGFVTGIVALVRLRRAEPRRRGTAFAVTAILVPPTLFVAVMVLVAVALSNLELS